MTYNFDPDAWYANHREALKRRAAKGDLDAEALAVALADLERRFEDLVAKLDGTYEVLGRVDRTSTDGSEFEPGDGQ